MENATILAPRPSKRPAAGSLSRPGRRSWPHSRPARAVVLGVGVLAPVIARTVVSNTLSLPLMLLVAATAMALGTAARGRARMLWTRLTARHRDDVVIRRLAGLCRADDLPDRQQRVHDLVAFLAGKAGRRKREQKLLATASTLYRVGLVALPPAAACDPDGTARRARGIARRLLSGPTALHRAATGMALSHEESWDGAGFPAGMEGDEIPFAARLLQVALALDALLPRTGPVPDRATLAEIALRVRIEGGRLFDPALASLPARHLAALECLLTARLVGPDLQAPGMLPTEDSSGLLRGAFPPPKLTLA